jgi:hypothetical protein
MKNTKQVNLVALDAAELLEVQGGVTIGGCIPPIKPYPPYFPPGDPFPPIKPKLDRPDWVF